LAGSEYSSLCVCVTQSLVGMVFPNSGCSGHMAVFYMGLGYAVDKD
jgi:hypothetical protein